MYNILYNFIFIYMIFIHLFTIYSTFITFQLLLQVSVYRIFSFKKEFCADQNKINNGWTIQWTLNPLARWKTISSRLFEHICIQLSRNRNSLIVTFNARSVSQCETLLFRLATRDRNLDFLSIALRYISQTFRCEYIYLLIHYTDINIILWLGNYSNTRSKLWYSNIN